MTENPLIAARASRAVVPWWWLAVSLTVAGTIRWYAKGPGTLGIDRDLSAWVQGWDQAPARQLANAGNALGASIPALVLVVTLCVALLLLRLRRELAYLVVAACLRLLATFLKERSDSPRPTIAEGVEIRGTFDGLGFPSGHAITSAVVLGTVWFLVTRATDRPEYRAAAVAAWIVGMVLTDFARIWVGAHWFTDVLGGSIIGIMVVLSAANISALLVPDRPTPAVTSATP